MRGMDANSIDLTVTSPPYDNLREYGKDFDAASFDWRGIIAELYRVTKPGGVAVWVVADATINGSETGTSFRQALWAMDCGFNLHDTMIYQTEKMALNHNRYEQEFEYMFVFSKGSPNVFSPILVKTKNHGSRIKRNTNENNIAASAFQNSAIRYRAEVLTVKSTKYHSNIWFVQSGYNRTTKDKEAYQHPAIFPEQLAHDHIISWSNPGDLVFDPMSGSGTVGKMAMMTNRNFIGIELDPTYFQIAKERITKAQTIARGEFPTITAKPNELDNLPLFAEA